MIERVSVSDLVLWIDEFKIKKNTKNVFVPAELRPVILGMVSKESTFNPKAVRFEKDYEWITTADVFAKKLGISIQTEIALQSFSYGVMQIMGANCRAMGFTEDLFDLTRETKKTFHFGIRFFLNQIDRYDGNVEKALAAYNCGSAKMRDGKLIGQAYADDILNRSETYKKTWEKVS